MAHGWRSRSAGRVAQDRGGRDGSAARRAATARDRGTCRGTPRRKQEPSCRSPRLLAHNGVKESAADWPAPRTGFDDRSARRVATFDQRLVTGRDDARVVKFMAEDFGSRFAERAVPQQARTAIAKMQTASGERRLQLQESGHGMALPLRVFQPLAQHHVAATFAMNRRAASRCLLETVEKI